MPLNAALLYHANLANLVGVVGLGLYGIGVGVDERLFAHFVKVFHPVLPSQCRYL